MNKLSKEATLGLRMILLGFIGVGFVGLQILKPDMPIFSAGILLSWGGAFTTAVIGLNNRFINRP